VVLSVSNSNYWPALGKKKKKKSKTLSGNLEKRSKTVMGRGLNGKTLSSNPSRGKKMFQV
jgi:hypothetical protein